MEVKNIRCNPSEEKGHFHIEQVIQITAQWNLFGQMLMLSEEAKISMDRALSYPLSPLSWALTTADGLPTKTDKFTLLLQLEDETALTPMEAGKDRVYIIEMLFFIH